VLAALSGRGPPLVFTYPNADASGQTIVAAIDRFVAGRPNACAVPHLGSAGYFSLMAQAAAMVGTLQRHHRGGVVPPAGGRYRRTPAGPRRTGNVLHAPCERDAIRAAVAQATAPAFRLPSAGMVNPHGDGRAAAHVAARARPRRSAPASQGGSRFLIRMRWTAAAT
jgi:hypothetical protein